MTYLGKTDKPTETERMLNLGKQVTLKGLGEVTIKELSLEQALKATPEIIKIFQFIDFKKMDVSSPMWVVPIIQNPAILDALKTIVAAACWRSPADFNELPISDWLKILTTIKEVFDWEEIGELFFHLIPKAREIWETSLKAVNKAPEQ